LLSLFTLLVLGAMGWFGMQHQFGITTKNHPPGVLAASAPAQTLTANPVIHLRGVQITPRAQFQMTARVLAKKRYRFDRQADVMPYDFAMGWGVMSDTSVIERLHISQSGRWYFWSYEGMPPADPGTIVNSSANMHLIPIDSSVRKVLDAAVVGDIITINGDLADVAGVGFAINSSLTRSDSGGGACEVILVRSAAIQSTTA
jgi:hypothetical protein